MLRHDDLHALSSNFDSLILSDGFESASWKFCNSSESRISQYIVDARSWRKPCKYHDAEANGARAQSAARAATTAKV